MTHSKEFLRIFLGFILVGFFNSIGTSVFATNKTSQGSIPKPPRSCPLYCKANQYFLCTYRDEESGLEFEAKACNQCLALRKLYYEAAASGIQIKSEYVNCSEKNEVSE